MGFFSEDMVPMLGVYESETSELVGNIEGIAARAEQSDAFAPEDIAELFRCAHTIKGSSAMMGLEALSLLTHTFEDLFDLLRKDPSLSEGRVPEFLDHLYAFIDYAKDELERMSDDDYEPADATALIDELKAARARIAPGDGAPSGATSAADGRPDKASQASEIVQDVPASSDTTLLKVAFKPDVPMVNARAMVIVRQLKKQVSLLSHVPEDLMSEDAGKDINENGLIITVGNADADKARQLLAKNTNVRRITVLEEARVAPAAQDARQKQETTATAPSTKFVTMRWDTVQELQDLAGEFLLHASKLKNLCDERYNNEMRSAVSRTGRLVEDLVFRINAMAMVSVSAMIPQLSRMVRDMRRSTGKQLSFKVQGGDIVIDRNLYNSISDPLLHIIRNAVDHGIESPEERLAAGKEARGTIELSIENLGARVAFRISDDGRGIDTARVLAKAAAKGALTKPIDQYTHDEALQLVMQAGLSTAAEVTQHSGRGVGMDVVQTVIRDFDGRVDIQSEKGRGTSITLFMPVSVTSVQSLGFRIGTSIFHMPLFNLDKIYSAGDAKDLTERYVYTAFDADGYDEQYDESVLFTHDKRQIPVLDMHKLLACEGTDAFYIVCHSMEDEFAIGVDEIVGEFGCANKSLPICFDRTWQYACAIRNVAIMEDGVIGYALNAPLLAAKAQGRETLRMRDDEDRLAWGTTSSLETVTAEEIPEQGFIFTLGTTRYVVPVERVERLVSMPFCAPAPHPLPYLMGLASYRNRAIALFDLAKSAGVTESSPYVLIVSNEEGDFEGLAITSAIGVRNLRDAVLDDEQPTPRVLTGDLRTAALLKLGIKEPPALLLTRCQP